MSKRLDSLSSNSNFWNDHAQLAAWLGGLIYDLEEDPATVRLALLLDFTICAACVKPSTIRPLLLEIDGIRDVGEDQRETREFVARVERAFNSLMMVCFEHGNFRKPTRARASRWGRDIIAGLIVALLIELAQHYVL